MELSRIMIPYRFSSTPPKKGKMERHWKYYESTGAFLKPVVVNADGILIDGYVEYLIAQRCGMEVIEVSIEESKNKLRAASAVGELFHDGRLEEQSGYMVITNGNHYINFDEIGRVRKVASFQEARKYHNLENVIAMMENKPSQTGGYSVYNLDNKQYIFSMPYKAKRHSFSLDKRKRIYARGKGKCALCGKKIPFDDFTVDHIIPLILNGSNEEDNLQIACFDCNSCKGGIAPEIFLDRVTQIFMYQMEKKLSRKELEIIKMVAEV